MTTSASAAGPGFLRQAAWAWNDTWLMTWRNLMYYVRNPYWIFLAVVQPIIFTLLFVFVFGGAIDTGPVTYKDYALPGIIVQTVVFSSLGSGINIADDLQKGVMDRFRSLPTSRGTVLGARTLSDTVRNALSALVMAGVGYAIGYRFHGSFLDAFAALGLAVLFGYAFSWIAATIGLLAQNTQTAEVAGFTWAFPLVFVSSIFVPLDAIDPDWLESFARWNPVTLVSDATRSLSLDNPGFPLGNDPWWAIAWCLGIIVTFRTLAVWRYRRLT